VHSKPSKPSNSPRRERKSGQSLDAVHIPDALLKITTVITITGLSESTIRRKVAASQFPPPVKDGARCTRWVARDLSAWLRCRAGSTSNNESHKAA